MRIGTVNPNPVHNQLVFLKVSFLVTALSMLMFSYGCAAEVDGLFTISPKQANTLVQNQKGNPDFVILDIRTPGEFQTGHIEDAVLLDFYSVDFLKKMKALDKNKTYLVYCRSANRSTKTLSLIKDMGFTSVYNMDRGIVGWTQNGFAIVK